MTLKPWVWTLGVVLAVAACGGGGTAGEDGEAVSPDTTGMGTAGSSGQPEIEDLSVYAVRDPQIAAQLAVAADQGFFADHGINVTPQYFATGSEVAPGFASGDVQIGMASTMAMIGTVASGFDVTMIGVVSEVSGGIGVVVRDDLGYAPQDLVGKKLGLVNAPPLRVMLANLDAELNDLSLDDVELVNFQDPPSMVTALANGDIDALAIWNPAFLNATQFGHILFSGTTNYMPDGKPSTWDLFAVPIGVYTTPEFAQENPNTMRAVLSALRDATDWIQQNPDGLAELLSELLQTPLDLTQQMVDQNVYTMSVDDRIIELLRSQTQFVYDEKLIAENPDPSSYVDLQFLGQVDPALAGAKL